ncbi:hypothetical protein [Nannocystis bainbridge]|uniref:Uncharacterized protein n=1 Tax=Nannocystis bainbridge TaxID=2995303 RepID=A0ABT5E7X0_9BACT|nr:hypothetical protein [Nannocystis bainbridge]MDC0721961.1 hypothetical protein [Nannocystis bainbridge]
MPSENCCVTAGELRNIYFESGATPIQTVYEVPAGKIFVLTAWTLVNEGSQVVTGRLRRGPDRVAFNRVFEPGVFFSHVTYPNGIAFGPLEAMVLETPFNSGRHYFFGYEHDVP